MSCQDEMKADKKGKKAEPSGLLTSLQAQGHLE